MASVRLSELGSTAYDGEPAPGVILLMPLDSFVDQAALRMEVVGSKEIPPVQAEVQTQDAAGQKF